MKSKLLTQVFSKFRKEKHKMDSSARVDFANGQTHKKASKNQDDLRLLRLLSSELLQDQNENQAWQPKLLGFSTKTLIPMELT